MKILFVNTWFYPNMSGGSQNSVKLLAEELYKKGHAVAVFSVDKLINENQTREIDGIKLFKILPKMYDLEYMYTSNKTLLKMMKNKFFEIFNRSVEREFRKILLDYNPDIVHFNSISGMPLSLSKIAKDEGCKTVLTLRDYFFMECVSGESIAKKAINKVYRQYSKGYMNYFDAITSPSEFTLAKFNQSGFFKKNFCTVIPNAIDINYREFNNLIEDKKLSDLKKKKVLFVGSIIEKKGIFELVRIFKTIDCSKAELYIAGKGSGVEKLKELIHSQPNIIYCGTLGKEDLFSLYKQCDLLVVPSIWDEPFGRVIVEGAINGLPVLTSNRGGMPEIVEKLQNGIVFSYDSDGEFESVLRKLIDMTNYVDYLNNIQDNIHMYGVDLQIEKFIEVYEHILANAE